MRNIYNCNEWYDEIEGFTSLFVYTNKYYFIDRRWRRWKRKWLPMLLAFISFRILKTERQDNKIREYILNKLYDDMVFDWIDRSKKINKIIKNIIRDIKIKSEINTYRADIRYISTLDFIKKKKLKIDDDKIFNNFFPTKDKKIIDFFLEYRYTDDRYQLLLHDLCSKLGSYVKKNNINTDDDVLYKLVEKLFIEHIVIDGNLDTKCIQITFLLDIINTYPPEHFIEFYRTIDKEFKMFEFTFKNDSDNFFFTILNKATTINYFSFWEEFVIKVISFSEFFLFSMIIFTWIFFIFYFNTKNNK